MTFNNSPKGHKDEGMEEVADEQQVDPTGEQEDEVIDEEAAAEEYVDLDEKLDEISQFMDELNEKSDELKSRIASLLTDMKSDRREGS